MQIKQITSNQELERAIMTGVALVDFSAPWCGPCRVQEPIMEELSIRFKDKAIIATMDLDRHKPIALKLGIKSIPTLTLFRNGREVQRFIGLQPAKTLADAIEANLA
jgi:thioredoxin 1